MIEQQKRPWPETLQLDTNVQICRVIELHNGTEALEGWKGHGFLRTELFLISIRVCRIVIQFLIGPEHHANC